MGQDDEYRRNANYCLHMAHGASYVADQQEWLHLAQSWLELIRRRSYASAEAFDAGQAA
jgi:hypothetical protein